MCIGWTGSCRWISRWSRSFGCEILDHFLNELFVRRGKAPLAKFVWVDPTCRLALDELRLAADVLADERVQSNDRLRVRVLDRRELNDRRGDNVDLLTQLARETLMKRFAGFDFPAGELPVSAERVIVLA